MGFPFFPYKLLSLLETFVSMAPASVFIREPRFFFPIKLLKTLFYLLYVIEFLIRLEYIYKGLSIIRVRLLNLVSLFSSPHTLWWTFLVFCGIIELKLWWHYFVAF